MENSDISWDIYRTFLAVLEEGSLSAAARSLGLTQPSIGRHIDALEAMVGYQLFTRTRLGLIPNIQALELRPYAEALAAQARALRRVASAQGERVRGTVRISASEVMGVEVLPKILSDLMSEFPEITIELTLSDALADLLNREVDIALRMTPPTQDALMIQKAGEVSLGLYASSDYLTRRGVPETMEDLKNHTLIGFDRETNFIRAMRQAYPFVSGLDFNFKADSNLAQLSAIRAGLGIGICQTGLAHEPIRLTRLFPEAVNMALPCYVAMHENLKSVLAFRHSFQALARGLKGYVIVARRSEA